MSDDHSISRAAHSALCCAVLCCAAALCCVLCCVLLCLVCVLCCCSSVSAVLCCSLCSSTAERAAKIKKIKTTGPTATIENDRCLKKRGGPWRKIYTYGGEYIAGLRPAIIILLLYHIVYVYSYESCTITVNILTNSLFHFSIYRTGASTRHIDNEALASLICLVVLQKS